MRYGRAIVVGLGASAAAGLVLSVAGQPLRRTLSAAAAMHAAALMAGEPAASEAALSDAGPADYAGAFPVYSWTGEWVQLAPIPVEPPVMKPAATPPRTASQPPQPVLTQPPFAALPPVRPPADTEILAGMRSYAPPASRDTAPPHAPAWALAFRS